LIEKIKTREIVDDREKDKNDGEILAMFLKSIFQSALLKLDVKSIKSIKSFKKEFKF
jgi:hypothetical protein